MWRIQVDRSACLGTGICLGTAGEHFHADDEGRSLPRSALVAPDGAVLDAALACPAEAIRVLDADTGQLLAPGIPD